MQLASFGATGWLRFARRVGFVRRGGLASFGAAGWLPLKVSARPLAR
jgi:hypothetical protein